jgi:excinuclease ABC subunit A
MGFLPSVFQDCDVCKGTGYAPELWEVKVHDVSMPELGKMTIKEVYNLFKDDSDYIERYLRACIEVGLDYLVLQQPGHTLSGGEAQRMKIANELCKKSLKGTLYLLDEPTLGLSLSDTENLICVLRNLVTKGSTVIVVEHHPNILTACDWLIELGPSGGPEGGFIIAEGSPEEISRKNTPTAPYIQQVLEESK